MGKNVKKVLAVALTVAAAVGLMACGDKDTDKKTGTASENKDQFVYVPEYQTIKENPGQMSINYLSYYDGILYYDGYSQDPDTRNYDGGLFVLKPGETEPAKFSYEKQDNFGLYCFTTDNEGNLVLCGLNTGSQEEAGGTDDEAGEGMDAGAETVGGQRGSLMLLRLDPTGGELDFVSLDGVFKEENSYVQRIEVDKDGNICAQMEDKVYVIDPEGNLLFTEQAAGWINSMGKTKDGTVVICCYGGEGLEIRPVDTASKALGKPYQGAIPAAGHYGNIVFGKGSDQDLIYSLSNKVYTYDIASDKSAELLDWMDVDINDNEIKGFYALEDGRIQAFLSESGGNAPANVLAYLTRKPASEVTEKTQLTFGTMGLNAALKRRIIDFNKTSDEYRIEIKEYEGADYEESVKQMNNEIISGKCPDIIDLSQGLSFQQYAAAGVLEDLNPYLDNDKELKRENFLENVLKSYETNGRMYGISSRYSIATVLAKASDVKDRSGWTMDEMMEFIDSRPEATEVMEYVSGASMLKLNLEMNLDKYVDWETGVCSFDSGEFKKVLEFCSKFPLEDKLQYDAAGPNTHDKIQDGKLLMVNLIFGDIESYQLYEQVFGEPIAFIGYPTDSGNGSFIQPSELMGMSSTSEHKDGVWQFLRMGLTEEYQNPANEINSGMVQSYGFPVMKSAMELQFKEAMEPEYYVDENGNQIETSRMSYGIGSGDEPFVVQIYASTQEEVDAIRELIENITKGYQFDEQLFNIIHEEAAPFFQGQKNVDAAADIIQNRAKIYVNENR